MSDDVSPATVTVQSAPAGTTPVLRLDVPDPQGLFGWARRWHRENPALAAAGVILDWDSSPSAAAASAADVACWTHACQAVTRAGIRVLGLARSDSLAMAVSGKTGISVYKAPASGGQAESSATQPATPPARPAPSQTAPAHVARAKGRHGRKVRSPPPMPAPSTTLAPLAPPPLPAPPSPAPLQPDPAAAPHFAPAPSVDPTTYDPAPQASLLQIGPLSPGRILVHPGDVVVCGDVEEGASIVAGGHLHIYGALRGTAVAGQSGRPDAHLFCLMFHAQSLRIGKFACDLDAASMAAIAGQAVDVWYADGAMRMAPLGASAVPARS